MKNNKAFTMVELMVVVLIVGILAAVAVPMMTGRIDSSKWSEAKSAMGTIASALRSYAAEKGSFTSAPTLADIGLTSNDLDGTYLSHDAYAITSAAASNSQVAFVITCTAASSTRSGKPSTPATMTLTSSAANNYVATFAEGTGGTGS
jgi:prepilin-type N-terminal cleavage/methylation domain-containing protein